MHANSKLIFQKYAIEYLPKTGHVLEIGPDQFPSTFQELISRPALIWDTLDIYKSPQLTYTAISEYDFPIPDNYYDVVLSGQVIEHVRKPWIWMRELARVCKPGGVVITINPVSWPFHPAPIDCWRAFPDGMTAVYEDAELDVILSKFESLEALQYSRHLPGKSAEWQGKYLRIAYRILGRFGFPVERAYDTVTIGRKVSLSKTSLL